jgi:hypothetical protein
MAFYFLDVLHQRGLEVLYILQGNRWQLIVVNCKLIDLSFAKQTELKKSLNFHSHQHSPIM